MDRNPNSNYCGPAVLERDSIIPAVAAAANPTYALTATGFVTASS